MNYNNKAANYPGARHYKSHFAALLAAVGRRKRLQKTLDELHAKAPSRPTNQRFLLPGGARWFSQLPRYSGSCLNVLS